MVSVAKGQRKRSEYVINCVDSDKLQQHRLLVAFEHCLMSRHGWTGAWPIWFTRSQRTKQSTPEYIRKLCHVSYYRLKQELIPGGEKCGFTFFLTSKSFPHIFPLLALTLTISPFSSFIFLLFNVLCVSSAMTTLEIRHWKYRIVWVGVCVSAYLRKHL